MTGVAGRSGPPADAATSSRAPAPACRAAALHHGYDVAETYIVSESAWNGGKDGGEYKRMLRRGLGDAHAGKFSVLVVWALDRITREGAEGALRIIRQFREHDCTVVSVRDSWLNGWVRR
jgi:DNA invertase Pin-like site-specific DNA recombinase